METQTQTETEAVIFATRISRRFSLRFKSERIQQETQGQLRVIPQQNIEFQEGIYKTDDPEKIAYIRASRAFKVKEIFEVTPADRKAMMGPEVETIRGSVSSSQIHKEAGVKEHEIPPSLSEQSFRCDVEGCDRVFKGAAALATHKHWHRRNADKKQAVADVHTLAEKDGGQGKKIGE